MPMWHSLGDKHDGPTHSIRADEPYTFEDKLGGLWLMTIVDWEHTTPGDPRSVVYRVKLKALDT